MTTIWVQALAGLYRATLDDMAIVLRGCPPQLWETGMWKVNQTDEWAWPPTDRDGQAFDDPPCSENASYRQCRRSGE